MIAFPIADFGGLWYGKADSEEADFYIQCTDGVGYTFYSSDDQCVFH